MSIGAVCNREVVFVERGTAIGEAARLMRKYHVGNLVVATTRNSKRYPVGIVTDRDLVIEVMAAEIDPQTLTVADVMSGDLVTAREDDDLVDTLKLMRTKGIRRLPVVARDKSLVGILTVDDLIDLVAEQLADVAALIEREQKRERKTRR